MPDSLASFAITADGARYRLQLILENGAVLEAAVSFDQLDQLSEEIDRRLDADEDLSLPEL
ncbi:MAG TPA: hypothetical protein VF489_04105 [Sphingobium sp.]